MLETLSDSFETADFGDEGLNKRYVKIVDSLSEKPNMSIPAATVDDAGREATYRFINNKKVSPPVIRGPHVSATQERIRQSDVALLVQDTTQIDVTRPNQQVVGTGTLEFPTRFGAFYHPLMAFDVDGIPLGEVWNKTWIREKIETQLSRVEKTELRKATPIEDKESIRWVEGLCAAREVAKTSPTTQCVCIGDSEADIDELFAEPRDAGGGRELELLVRA